MNSVHEQCPNSDSETVLSLKTGSKLSQVHKAPNLAQPAHTGAPRRVRMAVSWALRPCHGRGPRPCRKSDGRVAGAPAPCRGRSGHVVAWPPGHVATQRLPQAPLVPIHPIVLRYNSQLPAPAGHNTPRCIAIQTQPSSHLSHNTIGVLRHTYPLANLHAYCNTICCVAI